MAKTMSRKSRLSMPRSLMTCALDLAVLGDDVGDAVEGRGHGWPSVGNPGWGCGLGAVFGAKGGGRQGSARGRGPPAAPASPSAPRDHRVAGRPGLRNLSGAHPYDGEVFGPEPALEGNLIEQPGT